MGLTEVSVVVAIFALVIAALAWYENKRSADAAERQATEAEKTRQLQAGALKSQADDTSKALDIAMRNTDAAERSALHASDSVQLGRESLHRSLRPYVTIEEISPGPGIIARIPQSAIDVNIYRVPREASITVINTGQTPACHLEIQYCMDVLDHYPQTSGEYDQQYRGWMPTDLGHNQTRTVLAKIIGKDETLEPIASQFMRKLLVFGRVKYRDMFSDDDHVTEFCFIYDVRREQFVPAGPVNSVS
jgi:hypothetical protein